MSQFELDVQGNGVSAMDTALDPVLLLSIPQNQNESILSTPSPTLYLDKDDPADPVMHMSMVDISNAFLNAMDVIDPSAPSIPFSSDYTAHPDPFALVPPIDSAMNLEISSTTAQLLSSSPTQIPSPGLHGSASSYAVGVTSSLESALDPTGVSTARSRASASVSPPANSLPFTQSPPQTQQPVSAVFNHTDPALSSHANGAEPHHMLLPLLKQIAQTAESAGYALSNHDDASATSKVDQLKASITKVSEMLDRLSVSKSDQSRKRCATELDEGRTVKSLKREPPEDSTTLSLPQIDPSLSVPTEQSPVYPTPISALPLGNGARPIAPLPQSPSQPPSRTSSPPKPTFSARSSFSPPQTIMSNFPSFIPSSPTTEFPPKLSRVDSATSFTNSQWNDSVLPTSRHHHSLSAGAITSPPQTITIGNTGSSSTVSRPLNSLSPNIPNIPQPVTITPSNSAISPPIGRMSRSGSINGLPFGNTFTFNYMPADSISTWPNPPTPQSSRSQSQSNWYFGPSDHSAPSASPSTTSDVSSTAVPSTAPETSRSSPTDAEDNDDDDSDGSESPQRASAGKKTSNENHPSNLGSSSSPDVPAEYRTEVDRIFFEYLNKICSNLDATDSKGEPIHQTLMAKKMQRLDESPDFRPFKFRIQAFTLAFLEELARQGYPEEKIPMKKIRNYLWRQPHILRFNEDGKKAKSKGNHIWNIEARKTKEGNWEFRPFHRKLVGHSNPVAYCGLQWSWTPRIWDPQASWQNVPVTYSSPNLPFWLSWKDDVLSGIPPPDAQSCTISVDAKFIIDGQEGHLSHTFALTIAPMTILDSSYSRSRRPSFVGEPPKRSTSDSALFQAPQRARARAVPPVAESADTRVIRVLQTAANQTETQLATAHPPNVQDLVKLKQVLDHTVYAYGEALSGEGYDDTHQLAVAAQNVVVQAAHKVYADRGGGVLPPPLNETAIQSVTVGELTDVTQDAIAKAVKRNGRASTEVDIVVAAATIIKSESDATHSVIPPQIRSVSTGTLPTRLNPVLVPSYPNNLSPLPEYS